MPLRFFNTLTRKKEIFKPLKDKRVGLYTCGPTVYDYVHLGNCRAFVFYDILKRYLEWKGLKVKHIMNLTDVDDKTINGSRKKGVPLAKYTQIYKDAFFEDLRALGVEKATGYPEATKHIKEMVSLIKILLKKGYGYKTEDGIYFDISKFKDYGKLAHIKVKELKIGARVKKDEYKEEAQDFCLWKFWDKEDGGVFWDTALGRGRPGWHIECSAMSSKYLGETFDIHCGGIDLIFPHHENETAQNEAVTGKRFVNYWLHNEFLLVDGKKMSKSLKNFYTLRDLIAKGYDTKTIRYFLLSSHYRQKLNLTFPALDASKAAIEKLENFMRNKTRQDSKKMLVAIKTAKKAFEKAMDNDLNTPEALAAIFNFIRKANSYGYGKKAVNLVLDFNKVLNVIEITEEKIPKHILALAEKREQARRNKNFQLADDLREEIRKQGYGIDDSKGGYKVKKTK